MFPPADRRRAAAAKANPATDLPPPEKPSPERLLADDHWVRSFRRGEEDQRPHQFRWVHPAVEECWARQERRDQLRRSLSARNPVTAANAAILLARAADPAGVARLAAAVGDPSLALSQRCAAVESLGNLPGERIKNLLDAFTGRQVWQSGRTGGAPPLLAAELLRALARHASPAEEPGWAAALASPAVEVRWEALRGYWTHPRAALPAAVADLRGDNDPSIRRIALRLLARAGHPDALRYLWDGLSDQDPGVRADAVAGLGELPDGRGRRDLVKLLRDKADATRSQAVTALAGQPATEELVLDLSHDKSFRVRAVVAQALRHYPTHRGAAVARQLLDDPSPGVQQAVVAAIRTWPLAASGPVLLAAMEKPVVMTRLAAARQLAAVWPPAGQFPADGTGDRRAALLADLQRRFRQEFGGAAGVSTGAAGPRPVPKETVEQVGQLIRQLADPAAPRGQRQQAADRLAALGPGAIRAMETLVLDRKEPLPEVVYRDVLPRLSPDFVLIGRLVAALPSRPQDPWRPAGSGVEPASFTERQESAGEVDQRRHAAAELAQSAAKRPLERLAVERLAAVVSREPDALVWQQLLTAVAGDASDGAARLAAAAIGHASPEIRRRACEHLAAHPDPRYAPVLLPALADGSSQVVQVAVRAIGLCGRSEDSKPLKPLLAYPGDRVQLEAALALGRLGDAAGPAGLDRLSYSGDPILRRQVALAMGELADRSFVATLIRLLDDQQGVRLAALEALPQVVGRDVADDDTTPRTVAERAQRWKDWHRGQTMPQGDVPALAAR
jgi:HEAT repeat protein